MDNDSFRALLIREADAVPKLEILRQSILPAGDVLIEVHYSSLNYKDGLALTDPGKVARHFPIVPGIDLAGIVVESSHPEFRAGQAVLAAGCGLGEIRWGGYAEFARLPAECLVSLPDGLTLSHSMSIGTAGFTAMLALIALEEHGLRPDREPVVVTGASGGVGSLAVAVLARSGYRAIAMTRRTAETEYLKVLGAAEIVSPDTLIGPAEKPLQAQKWSGAIDTVGGAILGSLCSSMKEGGSVAACGNAAGMTFHASVLPFILRSVNLLGINSVYPPVERRTLAWTRLAATLTPSVLDSITQHITLDDLPARGRDILAGRIRGRVVVDVRDRRQVPPTPAASAERESLPSSRE
jgi:acrylyl-CoA reductase (NADPH)